MTKRLKRAEAVFPNLWSDGYMKNSHSDISYNCISFAVGDITRIWDGYGIKPGTYWPTTPGGSLLRLIEALVTAGFETCTDAIPEHGYEKVALYENRMGWS